MRQIKNRRLTLGIVMAIVAAMVWPMSTQAQDNMRSQEEPYKYDFGLAMGLAGYWGDFSSNMFASPGLGASLLFHYRFDTRWQLRASFTGATVSGNNEKIQNMYPGGPYEFSGGFYDLDVRAEFNFFSFGIGETYKRLKRWTPYLGLGLGVGISSVNETTSAAPTLPMAVGVRYKANPRLNFGVEWTFNKVFGDKVDGYSSLTGIKTNMVRHTDWLSTIQVFFTYEFGRRCVTCNRID